MKQVVLLVEGQTEEQFVKEVLAPGWEPRLYLQPIVISTKKGGQARKDKGGTVTKERTIKECKRLLAQTHWTKVVLVLDYYGLHLSFGKKQTKGIPHERAKEIRDSFEREIDDGRFRFFLLIHEFEALLFSDPESIAAHFANDKDSSKEKALRELQAILDDHDNDPERINDHPSTAPSKRLESLFPRFKKVSDGVVIAKAIGIKRIRQRCRAFNELCACLDECAASD
ncbi:MAG: DUF4276 family protein [Bacteroidetes bacterium]|nr:MAG: DUF4276 family protein [Bacteroidota bacterium]